ncbi:MAG: hypothetical protein MJ134_09730 [Lachnospiraceae bacterium]|nr:hypothetical protein [Lachnospiraceae bacterium]
MNKNNYSFIGKQQNIVKKNTGFSIIMVIVAMAFVGVLVAVIMLASLYNFYTKATNRNAKDNFYTAESALEEIRAGLQIEVDKAFNVAYMSVFQDYTSNLSEKNARFGKAYRTTLVNSLQAVSADASAEKQYNLTQIQGYVTRPFNATTNVGAVVTGVKVDFLKEDGTTETRERTDLIEYTDGVRLEGVQVAYYDERGYVSIITTNILLKVPELDLINPVIAPPLEDYALIANEQLQIKRNAILAGGAYGGMNGILIDPSMNFTIKRADFQNTVEQESRYVYVITDKDIDVGTIAGSANLTIEPGIEVWANAINTFGGNLTMNARPNYISDIYLQDDLTIRGTNNKVYLSGGFYGFGSIVNEPENSSAIVINGTKTTLDLSGLSALKLAGNAYIATKKANSEATVNSVADAGAKAELSGNKDVRTGSSISSKAEQMAYLVPPQYVGWIDGKCVIGTNPVSEDVYRRFKNHQGSFSAGLNYNEVNLSADLSLSNYGASYEKVFVRTTSGNTWVYYYLKFVNAAWADRFFEDYFRDNKAKLNAYMDSYITSIKLNPTLEASDSLSLYLAGNMITGSSSNYKLVPYTSTNLEENSKVYEEFMEYENQFGALSKILRKSYREMTPIQSGNSVYENVVDVAAMNKLIRNRLEFFEEGSDKPITLITKGDYIWNGTGNDEKLHMIICDGDVFVRANFEGLIIASGNIYIDSEVTVSAYDLLNTAMMAETNEDSAFLTDESGTDVIQHMPLYFLVEGQEKEIKPEKDITDETYTASDFVIFENWSKQ